MCNIIKDAAEVEDPKPAVDTVEGQQREPVAVVGMACRLPAANNTAELWDLILNKVDGIEKVPSSRWTPEQGCFMEIKNREVEGGFLKCPIDEFDGKFFGMSPAELEFTDPQQRLMLEVTWEALEDAFIPPHTLHSSNTAIYTGTANIDYRDLMTEAGVGAGNWFRRYLGNGHGGSPGRLSFFFGTVGPSIATESGCSSSMVAVGLALRALQHGETDLALVCAANLILYPFTYDDLSPVISDRCKTFDASANGYGRAEGVATLVLKRVSDAVRSGDRIHAVVRGYGQSSEGISRSVGTPTLEGETTAMRKALEDAGVSSGEVSYLEAHGTGTPLGDPLEMEAIQEVYSEGGKRAHPLVVGSLKANIGHTEPCSGVAAILKTVLALKNKTIPPQRSLDKLHPKILLEKIPAVIPLSPVPWECAEGVPRIAAVTSIGLVGTDCHAILQEAPRVKRSENVQKNTLTVHLLAISAKSEAALKSLLAVYENFLSRKVSASIADVTYTAAVGRTHFDQFRAAVMGTNGAEILAKLQDSQNPIKCVKGKKPTIVFLFTGQGSQYPGMAQALYHHFPNFRLNFDTCDGILRELYGIEIQSVVWGEGERSTLIHDALYSQIVIFVLEICLGRLWESWGIRPDAVLGHSLGECAAAVMAGMLSLPDALLIVVTRSKLVAALPPGQMLVVRADLTRTTEMLLEIKSPLEIAALNSPDQTVVAGSTGDVEVFKGHAEQLGIKCTLLASSHAFHSRHMDPILDDLQIVAQTVSMTAPKTRFISGLEGKVLDGESDLSNYWVRHCREKVNFIDGARVALQAGSSTIFLEVGPQPVLSSLIQRNAEAFPSSPDHQRYFLSSLKRGRDDLETMLAALGSFYTIGFDIDWKAFYEPFPVIKVEIPFYQFQRKKYWYKIPAKKATPTMSVDGEEAQHPMLGRRVFHAGKKALFQKQLCLNSPGLCYLKDHALGDTCIVPAAGYLEMALAAGRFLNEQELEEAHASAPVSITVQNVRLEAPLGIHDDTCQFQVLVSPAMEHGKGTEAEVYGKVGGKWVRCASANVSEFGEKDLALPLPDFSRILATRPGIPMDTVYAGELKNLGYSYGPAFQSLVKFWVLDPERPWEKVWETSIFFPDEDLGYFCHPTWSDALLQAILFGAEFPTGRKFRVSVGIKRFTLFPQPESRRTGPGSNFIIHTTRSGDGDSVAVLYNGRNFDKPIAIMEGASFLPTTVNRITQAALGSQRSVLPQIMDNVWVGASPFEDMEFTTPFLSLERKETLHRFLEKRFPDGDLDQTRQEMEAMDQLEQIVGLSIRSSFLQLGFNPPVGAVLSLDQILQEAGISKKQSLLTHDLFKFLEEDGWVLRQPQGSQFQILKHFGSSQTEIDEQALALKKSMVAFLMERDFLEPCLSILPDVLRGTKSAIPVLLPLGDQVGTGAPTAHDFYVTSKLMDRGSKLLAQVFDFILKESTRGQNLAGGLRILEVGAGTGSATRRILPFLHAHSVPYSYTYTDISPAFFKSAELEFKDSRMSFKVLNLEEDPLTQGFSPGEFHILVASMVLHATRDLKETLSHLRILTKPGGQLVTFEGTKNTRFFDSTFGLLEGYWRFTDFELRNEHCLINEPKWHEVLASCGFPSSHHINVNGDFQAVFLAEASQSQPQWRSLTPRLEARPSWILFAPENKPSLVSSLLGLFNQFHRHVKLVEEATYDTIESSSQWFDDMDGSVEGILYMWGLRETTDQSKIAKPFLYLTQGLNSNEFIKRRGKKGIPRLVVVTEGVVNAKLNGHDDDGSVPFVPSAGTLWGMSRSLRCENPGLTIRCVDVDGVETSGHDENRAQQVFGECWRVDGEAQVAYREGNRVLLRLNDIKKRLIRYWEPLELPHSEAFDVRRNPHSCSPYNLKFEPPQAPRATLQGNLLEIQVHAFGLNSKDGLIFLKPDATVSEDNFVLGMELVGVVVAKGPTCTNRFEIGNLVIAVNMTQALPSHVRIFEEKVIALPKELTISEGATLPFVFATAYHSIVEVGGLKAGETVLLHSAAGGVGLAAIQICQKIGAKVIATAESCRKQNYLKSLGIDNVFNSRSTNFGAEVERVTNGAGVNLVINSLTGPGFKETSLKACGPSARFVEIGKLDVWKAEEVLTLRPDVKYFIVDLSADSTDWHTLLTHLEEWIEASWIKPLPLVRFDLGHVGQALRFLQGGNHIGKVVLTVPEIGPAGIVQHGIFNERSTYLVTGGLGGIGFELAKWMIQKGARNIVLLGRKGSTEAATDIITAWNASGSNVMALRGDVGDFEDCQRVLEFIKEHRETWPPLRGIMHAACHYSSATFENTSWDIYEATFRAKVNGAWNLHCLTKDCRLEHFVMFSSIQALLGGVAQGNYAAENAYLDSLVGWRRANGLPATTVNWGLWGEIGSLAHFKHHLFRHSSPQECFRALELLLKTNTSQAAVFDASMSELSSALPPGGQSYLWNLEKYGVISPSGGVPSKKEQSSRDSSKSSISKQFWATICSENSVEEKNIFVEVELGKIIIAILKHDTAEVIDPIEAFPDVGLDSLMIFEFKSSVQHLIGPEKVISVDDISNNNCIKSLAKFIVGAQFVTV